MNFIRNSIILTVTAIKPKEPNYGRFIDNLKNYAHGIKVHTVTSLHIIFNFFLLHLDPISTLQGAVYAVDESTIFIKSFVYDGLGPDAYFWVGKSTNPSPQGYIIPYPEDYVGG